MTSTFFSTLCLVQFRFSRQNRIYRIPKNEKSIRFSDKTVQFFLHFLWHHSTCQISIPNLCILCHNRSLVVLYWSAGLAKSNFSSTVLILVYNVRFSFWEWISNDSHNYHFLIFILYRKKVSWHKEYLAYRDSWIQYYNNSKQFSQTLNEK